MDPAFLRRIPYKLETPAPTMEVYHAIFMGVAGAAGLPFDEDIFRYIVDRLTNVENQNLACYQPAFIVDQVRSEEHTSELQSLMRISYAVFCLKKKKKQQ